MDIYLPRGLPARQARFLCLLAIRPSLTRADYQRLMPVSYSTAKRDLAQLFAAGLIIRIGRTSMRRYALSPLTLLPLRALSREAVAAADSDVSRTPGSSPDHVCISIDPMSIHGRR